MDDGLVTGAVGVLEWQVGPEHCTRRGAHDLTIFFHRPIAVVLFVAAVAVATGSSVVRAVRRLARRPLPAGAGSSEETSLVREGNARD